MSITTTHHLSGQTEIVTDGGMVTANHRLAAEAGAQILAQGGNAIDAAVATSFAVGVVEPVMSGIGGRGYMLIRFPESGEVVAIDGHERAPGKARPDMYRLLQPRATLTDEGDYRVPVVNSANSVGPLAVAIPGVLGALAVAHQRYGRLPLATVLEPAIALAEEGFDVSVTMATSIAIHRGKLGQFPATAEIFLPNSHAPAPGERFIQRDLARSYRLIAEHGADEFYRGSIARVIAEDMERSGGILTERDLAEFEPRIWDQPITGSYRGYQILGMPDATGCITLIQIMHLLEGYDLSALEALEPKYLHLVLESLRIAFQDRLAVIEDGEVVSVPYAGLASKAFASDRRKEINLEQALETVTPGDAWPFDEAAADPRPHARKITWRPVDNDTTHFCVVDRDRVTVSMTQSIIDAFGSGVVAKGTGILLNSAMRGFNPVPGQRGSIAPGKRSVHNGTPTIVLTPDGRPRLAIGGEGGTRIITGVAQILVNLIDRGWGLQDAVGAPRVHNEGWESLVSTHIPEATREELRRRGHRFSEVTPGFALPIFSRINGIAFDQAGRLASGVDPYCDAGAASVV